jgi:hypothetical protein
LIFGVDFIKKFQVVIEINCFVLDSVINEIQTGHELSDGQRKQLNVALKIFQTSDDAVELPSTNIISHYIDTGDARPFRVRPYIYSPYMQEKINQEVERMLKIGVIEPSTSQWANAVVATDKKDGRIRLCLDSRKLNAITTRDAYPLPHINRILGRFRSTKYLSAIDLKDCFWQVELDERCRDRCAFIIPTMGLFQYKRLPFGLHGSSQTVARAMDMIIGTKFGC